MADIHWGTPTAWADVAAAASWSALANGSQIVSGNIDNTVGREEYAEVSIVTVTSTAVVPAGGHVAVFVLPSLHDGTTYPNNSVNGAALPAATYMRGVVSFPAATIPPSGSVIVPVPYGVFRISVANRLGVSFPTSTTNITVRYRLISEAVV